MEAVRESAIIRLRPDLMARAKRQAKAEHVSFNAFVERTLEHAVEPEWPVLPPDYKISDEILRMNGSIRVPSKKQIESDPRLKHIMEECNYEG